MKWTKTKPTKPGWYWVRNTTGQPGVVWEAIAYVQPTGFGGKLYCSWMTAPGKVGIMLESEWSPDALWCGPIPPPEF